MRRGRRYVRLDLDNFNDFLPTTFRPNKDVPEKLVSRSPRRNTDAGGARCGAHLSAALSWTTPA
jgi:hypothetical protein